MREIAALPRNGYDAVSLFSGCGGVCLGMRMAGFRVLWANEFVPAARAVYKLNHPHTILDGRDIREIKPEEILAALDRKPGEIDVCEGSPPCASFSTAGKISKGWGKQRSYSDTAQRSDDLFFEYIRIVKGLQPRAFVAENVNGLVRGASKGYFKIILAELKKCGYQVEARLLDAQWLGVPQARKRIIFIGVRNDLKLKPEFPRPLSYNYSVREVLPHVLKMGYNDAFGSASFGPSTRPSYTIGASPHTGNGLSPPSEIVTAQGKRRYTIDELKKICGFPDDFKLVGSYLKQWERLGRAVPPVMAAKIAEGVRRVLEKAGTS
jgi:DNA (cytosine-5)-methyltransferase 1